MRGLYVVTSERGAKRNGKRTGVIVYDEHSRSEGLHGTVRSALLVPERARDFSVALQRGEDCPRGARSAFTRKGRELCPRTRPRRHLVLPKRGSTIYPLTMAAAERTATRKRSIVKAITYRAFVVCLDFLVIYMLTGKATIAAGFMIVSNIYTTAGYFLHERLWARIKWGITGASSDNTPTAPDR